MIELGSRDARARLPELPRRGEIREAIEAIRAPGSDAVLDLARRLVRAAPGESLPLLAA